MILCSLAVILQLAFQLMSPKHPISKYFHIPSPWTVTYNNAPSPNDSIPHQILLHNHHIHHQYPWIPVLLTPALLGLCYTLVTTQHLFLLQLRTKTYEDAAILLDYSGLFRWLRGYLWKRWVTRLFESLFEELFTVFRSCLPCGGCHGDKDTDPK